MIQLRSRLKVADNTGAKDVACFKVLQGRAQDRATLGDLIIASVKVALPHTPVKKKEVVRAVIVRQRAPFRRKNGVTIRFDDNAVVLVDGDGMPRGTRIMGPIAREIKQRGYAKIVSLAQEVI